MRQVDFRHTINQTLFESSGSSGDTYIQIIYPWQPRYGNPIRPLFGGIHAHQEGRRTFGFQTNEDFAAYVEEYAQNRPYLVETSSTLRDAVDSLAVAAAPGTPEFEVGIQWGEGSGAGIHLTMTHLPDRTVLATRSTEASVPWTSPSSADLAAAARNLLALLHPSPGAVASAVRTMTEHATTGALIWTPSSELPTSVRRFYEEAV